MEQRGASGPVRTRGTPGLEEQLLLLPLPERRSTEETGLGRGDGRAAAESRIPPGPPEPWKEQEEMTPLLSQHKAQTVKTSTRTTSPFLGDSNNEAQRP